MFGLFTKKPEEKKKRLVFLYRDFQYEAADIMISTDTTDEQIRSYLQQAFPALKNLHVKGVHEGSPDGVFKPLDRVNWNLIPEDTKFYLDVSAYTTQVEEKKEKNEVVIKTVRDRWGEGWRKCSKCETMFKVQDNTETSCKFVDNGFSSSEGVHKRVILGSHAQAKAKLPQYEDLVRDITTVGGTFWKSEGIGLVEHAKSGGSIGSAGENINGWSPEDFLAIQEPKNPSSSSSSSSSAPPMDLDRCCIM